MSYKLNITKDINFAKQVATLANHVNSNFPPNYLTDTKAFATYVLIDTINNPSTQTSHKLLRALESNIISKSCKTTYNHKIAYQQITVGLIPKPLEHLITFEPAINWGKNLAGYVGGDLAVDMVDTNNRPTLLRERMVLTPPWYAIGAKNLDMEKYENIQYGTDNIKINWFVTNSTNNTVFLDVGYLDFKKYLPKTDQTMVIFNSIHCINPGTIANNLPGFFRSALILQSLRDLFSSYIKKYQYLFSKNISQNG